MAGFNFGAFFGGGSGSDPMGGLFSSFNFTDYNAIKSGSYKKLVKSYYAKDKEESTSKKASKSGEKKATKIDYKDTTGLSKMKKESDALASSVDALSNKDLWTMKEGKYDMNKIADAVKSFVKDYNDTIAQSSKVTNSDVSKQITNMENMTNIMSKKLSAIGITAGTDGKLTVDENKLKNAKASDIKSLFEGNTTYASQIKQYANDAAKAAVNGASTYSANGTLSSALSGMFNNWV